MKTFVEIIRTNKTNGITFTREKEYERRSFLLRSMGYKSYKEYLKSNRWKRVCSISFQNNKKCSLCESCDQLIPHHILYTEDNLSGRNTSWIVVICTKCHELIHDIEKSAKINPLKATLIFIESIYPNKPCLWIKQKRESLLPMSKSAYKKHGVFGMQASGLL